MCRYEIILAIRVTVTVQCMDMQILSLITAHLEYREKTSRSIAKWSWLLWIDKNHIPVYHTKKFSILTWGNENQNWEIICNVIFPLFCLCNLQTKNGKGSLFFFKKKRRQWEWNYLANVVTNKVKKIKTNKKEIFILAPWNWQHIKSLHYLSAWPWLSLRCVSLLP